ncbi:glycosyltransferase [Shewanella metallivivens]|uniref:Glycosyltransferase n=1 Tax=Shewanella metallivivens TaxID=2872342 RepID=A0ABT5TL46_9GAMM|nr:glycosyltransferase [Shewanella metallivivens]MDD8059334.1 glycosyltransferase [Shewanella metallivivens]
MKILKLSTNHGGGATIAAERQAEALRSIGCEVKHLFIKQCWEQYEAILEVDGDNIFIKPNMAKYVKTDLIFQNYLVKNRTNVSNTYMSLWKKETEFDQLIFDYIVKEKFDVVHLHWTSNLVSSRLLLDLNEIKVKIVITGHDMNHFTGACHYDAGCNKHTLDCSDCSHLNADSMALISSSHHEKKSTFEQIKPHYIFPSNWLEEEYRASSIGGTLGNKSSSVIRNCVDINFFKPLSNSEREMLRSKLGFHSRELVIVSGAENNHEIRKGFSFFEHAVKKINTKKFGLKSLPKIKFVAFGGGDHILECTHPDVSYQHLGILNEQQVKELFQSADLLSFTSIEENFANIILEALMCGCPVLGFNLGGIPDIVHHNLNGRLVQEVSEDGYSEALCDILLKGIVSDLRETTIAWREGSSVNYSPQYIANELLALYKKVRSTI